MKRIYIYTYSGVIKAYRSLTERDVEEGLRLPAKDWHEYIRVVLCKKEEEKEEEEGVARRTWLNCDPCIRGKAALSNLICSTLRRKTRCTWCTSCGKNKQGPPSLFTFLFVPSRHLYSRFTIRFRAVTIPFRIRGSFEKKKKKKRKKGALILSRTKCREMGLRV